MGSFSMARRQLCRVINSPLATANAVRGLDGHMTLAAENGWTLRNDLSLNLDCFLDARGHEIYTGVDVGHVAVHSPSI